jgi:hypothetical protein
VSTFLEVFFAFISGGITLWGLLQVEKYLKRHREALDYGTGERTAHEFLKTQATQLQQAAARLSKPHVAPPATFPPPPHPTTGWGTWPAPTPEPPWPYGGKHEGTTAMQQVAPPAPPAPPTEAPIDPKGF